MIHRKEGEKIEVDDMDHQKGGGHKLKAKMYFQRATTFTIPARPLSPGHDRAFSGPIAPLVPEEARRRTNRGRFFDIEQEPTSPIVGCMGQIKRKKAMHKLKSKGKKDKNNKKDKNDNPFTSSSLRFSKFIKGKIKPTEKPVVLETDRTEQEPQFAPPIGQMKRFTSGRDAFLGFDWKDSDENHDSDDDEKVNLPISHSGPITSSRPSGEEQKKEVNLWKRRTIVPPRPLHLN